ncbi:NTPase KAP [Xylella taiwanensis]|uniref:NTPase KAP n=1 Tax=Xylella taiwanensis TaxID=1444770 RepID=Z9JJK0_9GAMM|nr:Qat anti-phage system ATPase QatA [Xylella taiwanensis]AXI83219.1 NTPase KAP [Xylella taiwanensis]EWS77937.1 NTPase KAP [Xylella taiwanensis]MCD8456276.1 NTPase KAP [Xylella taiwanensis]MCD8458684.1 NTPase KAP [Xylella taiwanensis]MCD8460820.1 NTPase KAP [Xylella taiwanensis]
MILSDHETNIDLLNNEAIATTIIKLLGTQPNHPVTIGVHGDWGAGKSSVLEMIDAGFADQDAVLCLKFNGWRFQGFEDAKIALIEGIVTGLIEKRPALNKLTVAAKNVLRRIDLLKIAKRAGSLVLTAFTGMPTPEQSRGIVGSLEVLIADPTKRITKEKLSTVIDDIKAVLKPGESKHVSEEVEAFRKAFAQLLKDADIKQLVVLIDDLDRCLPDTAIETLEAIRLFVFTAQTAFVVAADEAMIEYAVRKHFPDLPDSTGPRDYARHYLEKLIQVPFRIPALGETETRIYVTLLLAGTAIGENDENYRRLIAVAREQLKRPWSSGGLDAAMVKTALGQQAEKANNALALSDQIGPILASGTKGNPRQIKRFLNTLLLRAHMATARGFGNDITLPVLAKLMLAERFIPKLFEQIASVAAVHPQGRCEDLETLEKSLVSANGKNRQSKRQKVAAAVPASDNTVLNEWKSSETARDWAHLSPKLSGLDLRPYLFVTKDKKDYFGPVSVLGHLAGIVEKLFGSKIALQSYKAELKQLLPPEAEKVFEAVRSKIMSTGTFAAKPAGIDGLAVLVEVQPGLQSRLLDFLEALPHGQCGSWPAGGWEGALKDRACNTRLTKLLEAWSKAPKSTLSIAATAMLTYDKEGR